MEKQKKLIIYHHYLAEAGGCETFVYNFCSLLRNWYNILVAPRVIKSEERLKYLLKYHMVKLI